MANRELTPWTGSGGLSPFGRDPFLSFRREMDRLFDDFFAPAEPRSFASAVASSGWPSLDVDETDQAYVVNAEVPGLEQKDIELSLRDNVLSISGEKREERKDEKRGRAYAERFYGQFRRSIPLPTEVDADKVEAKFKNGVLTVTLPKNAKAREKERRIEIR
jgi:HSP20 family protein